MAKVSLGKRPKSFKHEVTFDLPGEVDAGVITWQFKYRTRTEFGAFVDELSADAGVPPPKGDTDEDIKFSMQQVMSTRVDRNAEYLLRIADGWDVDQPFNLDALKQFCDELPGGALQTMEAYRGAITEGRLGNSARRP
jgi:hypothetical protein